MSLGCRYKDPTTRWFAVSVFTCHNLDVFFLFVSELRPPMYENADPTNPRQRLLEEALRQPERTEKAVGVKQGYSSVASKLKEKLLVPQRR